MSEGDRLPPTTAAVVRNPAEPAQLVQEAVVQQNDATEIVEDNGHDGLAKEKKEKKQDAGLGNYFVSIIT